MQLTGRVAPRWCWWWAPLFLIVGTGFIGCQPRQTVEPVPWPPSAPPQAHDSQRFPFLGTPDLRGPHEGRFAWRPTVPERPWKYIILHHTASDQGSLRSIDAQHRSRRDGHGRPWLGIGYHFLIGNGDGMGDGEIRSTFRWSQQIQGAHAGGKQRDYNELGIGVALVGNIEETAPSARQQEAARRLLEDLRRYYRVPLQGVIAHREVRSTACPGRHFPFESIVGRREIAWHDPRVRTDHQRLSQQLLVHLAP